MNKNWIKELMQIYCWRDMGPQANKLMLSYKRQCEAGTFRFNFYQTTGTVTLQNSDTGAIKVHKFVTTSEALEKIILPLK